MRRHFIVVVHFFVRNNCFFLLSFVYAFKDIFSGGVMGYCTQLIIQCFPEVSGLTMFFFLNVYINLYFGKKKPPSRTNMYHK